MARRHGPARKSRANRPCGGTVDSLTCPVNAGRTTTLSASVLGMTGEGIRRTTATISEIWKATKCSTVGIGDMDTAFEAIMKDALNNGWFTHSYGDVNSPLGFFGYVSNTQPELKEFREAMADTIKAYGDVPDEQLIGHFFAVIDSNGIIRIIKKASARDAEDSYCYFMNEYNDWLGDDDE